MLYLNKDHVKEIISHCREESPNEACGILAGKTRNVSKVYRMTNADKSTKTYLMDPKEQLRTMKEIRNAGLEMVGIYHSHPHSKAYPSEHDVELALYSEASYVIVSLENSENPDIRCFGIAGGKITEEECKIS